MYKLILKYVYQIESVERSLLFTRFILGEVKIFEYFSFRRSDLLSDSVAFIRAAASIVVVRWPLVGEHGLKVALLLGSIRGHPSVLA